MKRKTLKKVGDLQSGTSDATCDYTRHPSSHIIKTERKISSKLYKGRFKGSALP